MGAVDLDKIAKDVTELVNRALDMVDGETAEAVTTLIGAAAVIAITEDRDFDTLVGVLFNTYSGMQLMHKRGVFQVAVKKEAQH